MKATQGGSLNEIPDCTIEIPSQKKDFNPISGREELFPQKNILKLNNLPDISDSKSAVYNNEGIIGRSFPLYTYSHSADRTFSIQIHFFVIDPGDGARNLADLRLIQSAVYPRRGDTGTPYKPPPVCKLRCGDLLAKGEEVCAVLQSYSVKFPTDVAWEEETYCPYRFDVDTQWISVYTSSDLPYQNRIITLGR